jgi:hypothetical protein
MFSVLSFPLDVSCHCVVNHQRKNIPSNSNNSHDEAEENMFSVIGYERME